jgi:hypothetical protein
MVKKIKAIDIVTESVKEVVEEVGIGEKSHEEEKSPEEEKPHEEGEAAKEDEVKISEIIEEETEKPADNKKRVTCPACNKTMLERNFRYAHQAVCGKSRVRVKPIEAIIEERTKPKAKAKPVEDVALAPPAPSAPLAKPDYLELRKQYNNHLKEKKQQLVKKLVSRAF